jgi:hypothetical protein
VCLGVARPVRRRAAGPTPGTVLERALEMAEHRATPRESCGHLDDGSTAVAGGVIALVGSRSLRDDAADTDRVSHQFVFPSRMTLVQS